MNAAVRKLRQALGDSAEQPRYIETVPKRGYRLIANLECQPAKPPELSTPGRLPSRRKIVTGTAAAALIAVVGVIGFYPVPKTPLPSWQPVPLTTFPGFEANPALSPDGDSVAFTWNGEKQDNFDIYVMPLRAGAPARLTMHPADDVNPVWSPDGRKLAFLRRLGLYGAELLVIPAGGGPEHKLGEIQNGALSELPLRSSLLAWSRDNRWVAASHAESGEPSGIYLYSMTGEKRRLTAPLRNARGDEMPAFSPDGRTLAFCRLSGFSTSDIYLLPLRADLGPAGEPRRLTSANRWSANPAWVEGGRSILYIFGESTGDTRRELRLIDVTGTHEPQKITPPHDDVWEISLGRHLVYSRRSRDTNVWRADLRTAGDSLSKTERLISSTRSDELARYSPDNTKISFQSSRSGSPEIWIANADGSHPVQMTSFGGPLVGSMDWSPDGQWIAFHARPEGQADLFAIPAAGGPAKRLTSDPADDANPRYSHDGRWIYFTSVRSGQAETWRMPADGGEARQITTGGAAYAVDSVDGREIFYVPQKPGYVNEIWKAPVEGGQPVRLIGPTQAWPFGFAVTQNGVYYDAPPHSGNQRYIRFFSFLTGQSRPIAVTDRPFDFGMSVSPDGRYLLFDQFDELGSDLMLVENFRLR